MLYMVMDYGEADLSSVLDEHKKQNSLTMNKIRFFWEEILHCVEEGERDEHFVVLSLPKKVVKELTFLNTLWTSSQK